MKPFILNRALPFLIPLILFLLVSIAYYYFSNSKVTSELHNISQYECLIMGDSQMQRIQPDKFSFISCNIASYGEHFYYTYQKLKSILEFNDNKVERVILGVSLHSFSPVYCRLINTEYLEGRSSLSRYLHFIDLTSDEYLKKKDFLSVSFIKGVYQRPDWGGLRISSNQNPDSIIIYQTIKEHYEIRRTEKPHDPEQIKNLCRIEDLCRVHHVELFLVSLPYHSYYLNSIDNYYINILESTIDSLNYAKYVSYLSIKIEHELMSDGTHLNKEGSDIYSKIINDTIVHEP